MTMRLTLMIIGLLWIAWLAYWVVCSFNAKTTTWREPFVSQLRYRLPLWIAAWLLATHLFLPAFLSFRFLPRSNVLLVLSVVLVAAGLGLAVSARRHLGRNWSGSVTVKEDHTLVTSGPYAFVRHPIYSGILLGILGTVLAIGEWRGLVAFALVFASFFVKSRTEEQRMGETFADYEHYRRQTAALIPFVF